MKFFCAGLAALACSTPFRSIPGGEGASGAAGTAAGGAPSGGSGGVAGSGGIAGSAGTSGAAGGGSGSGGVAGSGGTAGTGGTGGTGPVGGSGGVAGSAGAGGTGGASGSGGVAGSAGGGGTGGMGGTGPVGGSGGSAGNAGASGGGGASGTTGLCAEELPGFSCVEAGTFTLGSPGAPNAEACREDDEALHTVTLTHAFWIQQTEVTQKQWNALIDSNPSYYRDTCNYCPVGNITWYEALYYANALSAAHELPPCYDLTGCSPASPPDKTADSGMRCTGVSINAGDAIIYDCKGYRLPTEAEWEVAYRAGTRTAYYNGASPTGSQCDATNTQVDEIGWYGGNSGGDLQTVGHLQANAFGLYDMAGNVFEWCWDLYEPTYPTERSDPSGGTDMEAARVRRGGAFIRDVKELRAAYRGAGPAGQRFTLVGLRLVRTVPRP